MDGLKEAKILRRCVEELMESQPHLDEEAAVRMCERRLTDPDMDEDSD